MTSSEYGKRRRLGRLLQKGKLLIVPVDDSLIAGPYEGLSNMTKTIKDIEASVPSAILGFKGSLSTIQSTEIPLILNLTASTIMGTHVSKAITGSVKEAICMGADCVAVHINYTSDNENQMMHYLAQIATEADQFGIPVLAISYPRKCVDGEDYNYHNISEKEYTDLICHCTRVSVELGADIIKTQYTGSCSSFNKVVEAAMGRPVIIAGGPLVEVEEAYEMARAVIDAGGAGISYGRNVYNQKNIKAFISGIKAIIYDDANVENALKIYRRFQDV
jgi:DhnA family fructose-bisphosphate aldolase class Ia